MYTLRKIAEEIGISKQALQKRISRPPLKEDIKPFVNIENGIKFINDEGLKLIKRAYKCIDEGMDASIDNIDMSIDTSIDNAKTSTDKSIDTSIDVVYILNEQLKVKDLQIEELNARLKEATTALENTTASLHAAQALHAGTMKTSLLETNDQPKGFLKKLFKK